MVDVKQYATALLTQGSKRQIGDLEWSLAKAENMQPDGAPVCDLGFDIVLMTLSSECISI